MNRLWALCVLCTSTLCKCGGGGGGVIRHAPASDAAATSRGTQAAPAVLVAAGQRVRVEGERFHGERADVGSSAGVRHREAESSTHPIRDCLTMGYPVRN